MRRVSHALDSSLDESEFLSVIGDGFVGNGQQGSQLRLRHQITLGLQDKPLEFGELGSGHVGESSTYRFSAQFNSAQCDPCLCGSAHFL
jgi:hypothetical protein